MSDNTALTTTQPRAIQAQNTDIETAVMEQVLIGGDLSKLTANQRLNYYNAVCNVLGLNPLTGPFTYIKFQGKLVLYPNKDAAEQLRINRGVSITDMQQQTIGDVLLVTVSGQDATGRRDVATGAVGLVYPSLITEWANDQKVTKKHPMAGERIGPDEMAHAIMKAETKAKRRLTFSLCGFSDKVRRAFDGAVDIDEDEAARVAVSINMQTGEIEAPGQPAAIEATQAKPTKAPEEKLKARIAIMSNQLYGDKAHDKRVWLAEQASQGEAHSIADLKAGELQRCVSYLENVAAANGWARDAQGHMVPPGPVQEPPSYTQSYADLFGDEPPQPQTFAAELYPD